MKKVVNNKCKKPRVFSPGVAGLAVMLVMSSEAIASSNQIATLEIPGIERSSKNIDLGALETKISNTDAIDLFDKLKLKNRIDSLTNEVDQIHNGQSSISLSDLKRQFEEFFLSTVAMLRKGDPVLAEELVMSRNQLWQVLTDVRVELPDTAAIETLGSGGEY